MLARALRRQPYSVLTAVSAEEATFILKSHHIDVVISDERMPGIHGTQFLSWVAEELPEVARFLLTGNANIAALKAINEGRVTRIFTKPCDVAALTTAIHEAIESTAHIAESTSAADRGFSPS